MTNEQQTESKKTKTKGKEASELAHTIREGGVAANIWKRQSQTGFPYFEFSLSRSYKSVSSGKTGYRSNFFARNEEQLLKVVADACRWISEHEPRDLAEQLAA